jgi:hypothetical protein
VGEGGTEMVGLDGVCVEDSEEVWRSICFVVCDL